MKTLNKVFPYLKKQKKNKKHRLFCFHHAGGNASVFRKWMREETDIEILPVELAGSGSRIKEDFYEDIYSAANDIATGIFYIHDGRPFSLYGHSMGAILAFETAYVLTKLFGIRPQKLIVSGRNAP